MGSEAVRSITTYNELRNEIKNMCSTVHADEAAALNSIDIIARIMYHYTTMRLDTLEEAKG